MKLKKNVLSLIMVLLLAAGSVPGDAFAIGFEDVTPEGSTSLSLFNYGWRGLFTGALAGLAGGFVRYADENNNDEVLRSIAYGSVAGAGVGLIAGIYDMNSGHAGLGNLLLKDMNLGGAFGVVVGSVYGGIDAIINEDWKSLGNGASWGYLSGMVLGVGLALYENSRPGGTLADGSNNQTNYSIVMLRDSSGKLCTGIGASRRF